MYFGPLHPDAELVSAARNGDTTVVKLLLENAPQVDPTARDSEGLRWAVDKGNFDIVELLLEDTRTNFNTVKSMLDLSHSLHSFHSLHLEKFMKMVLEYRSEHNAQAKALEALLSPYFCDDLVGVCLSYCVVCPCFNRFNCFGFEPGHKSKFI